MRTATVNLVTLAWFQVKEEMGQNEALQEETPIKKDSASSNN